MAPFWHPKSTKIYAKIDSKRHPKNDRFLDRFFAQVGSILEPKLGPKSRSRPSQNASPNFFLIFQDATRTAQEAQEHPRSKFSPFLVPKSDRVPLGPRFSRFLSRLNSNVAGLCESRCLFRAALYTSPPNTQSPANVHPLDILVQINPQST